MKKVLLVVATFAVVGLAFAVGQLTSRSTVVFADGPPTSAYPYPASPYRPVTGESVMRPIEVTFPIASRPAADRIAWEYKIVPNNGSDLTVELLNRLGNDGWEMCGVRQLGQVANSFYFRRERMRGANPGNQPVPTPTTHTMPEDHQPAFGQLVPPPTQGPEPFRDEPAKPTAPPIYGAPIYSTPAVEEHIEPTKPTPAKGSESVFRDHE